MQITPIVLEEFEKYAKYGDINILIGNYQHSKGFPIDFIEIDKVQYWIPFAREYLYNKKFNILIGTWYINERIPQMLKDVQVFDDPFIFNAICVASFNKHFRTYRFYHTKEIKCASDYKIALILACYNWGIGNLKKNNYNISKAPKETRNYIKKYHKLEKR